MSNIRWAEDLREPEDIREPFRLLYNEVVELRKMWQFYQTLFARENLSILADISKDSFQIIQDALVDSMTMAICRLRDPVKQHGHKNLSLTIFGDPNTYPYASEALERLEKACKEVVDVRNQRVGHASFSARTDPLNHPLPEINAENVNLIIELMEQTINSAYKDRKQEEFGFETGDIHAGDDLVSWLESHY